MKTLALVAAGLTLGLAAPAAAAVIHTLPDGVARPMPAANRAVYEPVSFADGVTFTGTNPSGQQVGAYFGLTSAFIFQGSQAPVWEGAPMAAVGFQAATFNFTFADPVAAALTELNWATGDGPLTLSVYDAAGHRLETLSFDADDPNYQTGFYGFRRDRNDISRLEISGYYFAARNLSTLTETVSAVPEPATWAMLIVGFGFAGAAVRRRRGALAAV